MGIIFYQSVDESLQGFLKKKNRMNSMNKECMHGLDWIDKWIDQWMNRWINKQTNKSERCREWYEHLYSRGVLFFCWHWSLLRQLNCLDYSNFNEEKSFFIIGKNLESNRQSFHKREFAPQLMIMCHGLISGIRSCVMKGDGIGTKRHLLLTKSYFIKKIENFAPNYRILFSFSTFKTHHFVILLLQCFSISTSL